MEIGQLAVLLVLVPAISLLFRYVVPERLGIIILSALVAHTGWHWMMERGGQLAKFPFPTLDAAFIASAMRGLMAVLILGLAVLLANGLLRRWIDAEQGLPAKDAARPPRRELVVTRRARGSAARSCERKGGAMKNARRRDVLQLAAAAGAFAFAPRRARAQSYPNLLILPNASIPGIAGCAHRRRDGRGL